MIARAFWHYLKLQRKCWQINSWLGCARQARGLPDQWNT